MPYSVYYCSAHYLFPFEKDYFTPRVRMLINSLLINDNLITLFSAFLLLYTKTLKYADALTGNVTTVICACRK